MKRITIYKQKTQLDLMNLNTKKTKINCHTNYFQIQERKIKPKNKVEKDWRRVKVNSSEITKESLKIL